uniref:F-box domain-containing protein n=1 Tax=Panagrellus redivivus TaxID=6233 RepID=A0A7E4VDE9_PANRE
MLTEIALHSLPYSITRRLVDLMPFETVVTFSKIDSETKWLTERRFYERPLIQESSTELLQRNTCLSATDSLVVHFETLSEADQVTPRIGGTYSTVTSSGDYSWRHAMKLVHPKVTHCRWDGHFHLDEADHCEFVEELFKVIVKQRITITLFLTESFSQKLQLAARDITLRNDLADSFQECRVVRFLHMICIFSYHKKNVRACDVRVQRARRALIKQKEERAKTRAAKTKPNRASGSKK